MAFYVYVFLLVVFLLFCLALLCRLGWLHLQPSHSQAGRRRTLVHRLLKPRTPLDCPTCRLCSSNVKPPSAPVHLYWLLGSSVQKQALRDGERSSSPACKHRRVAVQSDIVDSILMLERRYSYVMEQLLLWRVF